MDGIVYCMECGRPWGVIGSGDDAAAELRSAWSDYALTNEYEPAEVEIRTDEVIYVNDSTADWWCEKFDVGPEAGYWSAEDVHAHGVPQWATKSKPRLAAVRTNCCDIDLVPQGTPSAGAENELAGNA